MIEITREEYLKSANKSAVASEPRNTDPWWVIDVEHYDGGHLYYKEERLYELKLPDLFIMDRPIRTITLS